MEMDCNSTSPPPPFNNASISIPKTVLTIGILVRVDAGKTSFTDCLLHKAGASKAQGSLDTGSAITDAVALEKGKGDFHQRGFR